MKEKTIITMMISFVVMVILVLSVSVVVQVSDIAKNQIPVKNDEEPLEEIPSVIVATIKLLDGYVEINPDDFVKVEVTPTPTIAPGETDDKESEQNDEEPTPSPTIAVEVFVTPTPSPILNPTPTKKPSVTVSTAPTVTSAPSVTSAPTTAPATPAPTTNPSEKFNSIMDSVFSQIIANPQGAKDIINANKINITTILSNSKNEIQLDIVKSYTKLFEELAKNPNASDALISVMTEYGIKIENDDSEEIQIEKANALSKLFIAISANQEKTDVLIKLYKDNLFAFKDVLSPSVQGSIASSYSGLFEAIQINNNLESLVKVNEGVTVATTTTETFTQKMLRVVTELKAIVADNTSGEVLLGQAQTFKGLLKAVSSDAAKNDELIAIYENNLKLSKYDSSSSLSVEIQSVIAEAYFGVFEAISIDKTIKAEMLEMISYFNLVVKDINDETVLAGKSKALQGLFTSYTADTALNNELLALYKDKLGIFPSELSEKVSYYISNSCKVLADNKYAKEAASTIASELNIVIS